LNFSHTLLKILQCRPAISSRIRHQAAVYGCVFSAKHIPEAEVADPTKIRSEIYPSGQETAAELRFAGISILLLTRRTESDTFTGPPAEYQD